MLGIIQQYQKPKVNQEVRIQFSSVDLSSSQTQASLEKISSALQHIGAENISITSSKDGFFKIAYYSDVAVYQIEKALAEKVDITLDRETKKNSNSYDIYDFDVSQIEKGKTSAWDFEGHQVATINLKSNRSAQPKVFKFNFSVVKDKTDVVFSSKYNATTSTVFTSDSTSHNIPETRAGPLA